MSQHTPSASKITLSTEYDQDMYKAITDAAASGRAAQAVFVSKGDIVRRCVERALPDVLAEIGTPTPFGRYVVAGKYPTNSQLYRICVEALRNGLGQNDLFATLDVPATPN